MTENTIIEDISEIKKEILNIVSPAEIKQEILNTIYPIGSIYMSLNATNPSDFLGGGGRLLRVSFCQAQDPHTQLVVLEAKLLIS